MLVVGIDPGKKGGIVTLNGSTVLAQNTMESVLVGKSYNEHAMREALFDGVPDASRGEVHVIIERQGSRPGEGHAGAFKCGYGFGLWVGICAGMLLEYSIVSPATWQKVLRGAPGTGKERSILFAQRALPDLELYPGRKRKPHDGLADAACLALYGQRQLG